MVTIGGRVLDREVEPINLSDDMFLRFLDFVPTLVALSGEREISFAFTYKQDREAS